MLSRPDPSSRPPARAPRRALGFVVVAVAAGMLAFLSLRASSYLTELSWMPRNLARWADRHGVVRNTVAFFPFGLLVFGVVGRGWRPVLAAAAFGVAIEVPQHWMAHRQFDPRDIAAGWAGLAVAWLVIWLWAGVRRVLPAPVPPP